MKLYMHSGQMVGGKPLINVKTESDDFVLQ